MSLREEAVMVWLENYLKAVGMGVKAIRVLEKKGFSEEAAELREELGELGFGVLSDEESICMDRELEEMERRFLESASGDLGPGGEAGSDKEVGS